MLNTYIYRYNLHRNLIKNQILSKIKIKLEVKNMPYLIGFTKWPTDKTAEMVKKAIEVVKKYPEDRSLGELVVPDAFKGGLEGMRAITITEVKKGKLEEAITRTREMVMMYATSVEGFEYSIEVWATQVEAWSSIGKVPPE